MEGSLLAIQKQLSPAEFADFILSKGPIAWCPEDNLWLVSRRNIAKKILSDERFSADRTPFFMQHMKEIDPPVLKDFIGVVSQMMVMSDPPKHQPKRRVCLHAIGQYVLNALEDRIDALLSQYFKAIKDEPFDFVFTIAEPLPASVLADMFEIPLPQRAAFFDKCKRMTMFFGGASVYNNAEGARVNQCAVDIRDYFYRLIEQKRRSPSDDFMSMVLKQQEMFDLTDDELISQVILLFVAGQVTMTDQLCNNLYTLLTEKGAWESLINQPERLDAFIHEANRFDPSVTFVFRVASCDMVYEGCQIKQGDSVFISSHALNYDDQEYKSPALFDVARANKTNFTFGFGAHACLGAKVAHLQLKKVLQALMAHTPNLRLLENERNHYCLSFSGFKSLMLENVAMPIESVSAKEASTVG